MAPTGALANLQDVAEVFISYSRWAQGPRPDPADVPEYLRWQARTIALDLLDPLQRAVNGAGWRVWRDEPSLSPGDLFGDKIDAALLSCAGAVVLLDPDTLNKSPWVRWECSILTWRQRIQMPVRVVPVLIGVTPEQLDAPGYGPSRLDQTLAQVIAPSDVVPGSAAYADVLEAHAGRIVAALGELEAEPTGAVSLWVNRVAECLPRNWQSWRGALEPQLRNGERLQLSAYPARVVGRELLVAERDRFERILNAFFGFPITDRPTLKTNLEPVWVPADAATGIAEARERPPGERIIAVNASESGTGADVVRRGLPGASGRQRLQWTATAVTVGAAVDYALDAIEGKWGPGHRPDETAENLGGCFVMIACRGRPTAELTEIVTELANEHPHLTYVVMVGDTLQTGYERLSPELPSGSDGEVRMFHAMLDDHLLQA